ncbi:MAG: PIG-L family deacetylase [Burkholderiaceae bacterium]
MPTGIPSHSPSRRRIAGHGTDEQTWQRSAAFGQMVDDDVALWAERYRRIWLLAPHPDDEILALGGSLARLSALDADLRIVSVTDGEASHVNSSTWPPERLAKVRPIETQRGLVKLGIEAEVIRLGFPDGRIGAHREELLKMLVEGIEETDLLLSTCRFDGHPDHEACGDVAELVAELTGATVFEYPVWMWHWASPDEQVIPWARARRIPLGADIVSRKRDAIDQFESQITPDGAHEAVLPPHVLPRFLRPFEVVFK